MILRFGVENFRCFRDRVELSFVSTARRDEPSHRIEAVGTSHGVLPVIGLWGANASGKSSVLWALREMSALVERSFVSFTPTQSLPWVPFRMAKGDGDPPTTVDVDVLVDGRRHHYGFRWREHGIVEEWLYDWPNTRRRLLFHRGAEGAGSWKLSPALGATRQRIAEATRANALFLSTAAQHNHAGLSPVAAALGRGIQTHADPGLSDAQWPVFPPDAAILNARHRETVVRLLRAADLGVFDFRVDEHTGPTYPQALNAILEAVRQSTDPLKRSGEAQEASPPQWHALHLQHGPTADTWELPPLLESLGTKRILRRLNDVLTHLATGGLWLVDEIDTNLSPGLASALVGLYTDPHANPKGAQLLFTTHDTELLSALRTDEVVLVDKDASGVARLTPASDYRQVRTRDDLRAAFRQGRIGGVPALGDFVGAVARGWAGGA